MYDFKVRIKTDDPTVVEQPVDLSTLIEWRDKGYISPEDEVWSEYFTGGQWKKLREVNLAGSVETGRRAAQTQTPATLSTGTTKFCSNCGASLSVGVAFCGSCGAKVASYPADEKHVGWSSPQARSRVIEVQSAVERRKAQQHITRGVFFIILGAFLAVLGGPIAGHAQEKARWSLDVSSDVETQYKIGKVMSAVGPFLIVCGMALAVYGFSKRKDS